MYGNACVAEKTNASLDDLNVRNFVHCDATRAVKCHKYAPTACTCEPQYFFSPQALLSILILPKISVCY